MHVARKTEGTSFERCGRAVQGCEAEWGTDRDSDTDGHPFSLGGSESSSLVEDSISEGALLLSEHSAADGAKRTPAVVIAKRKADVGTTRRPMESKDTTMAVDVVQRGALSICIRY